MGAGALVICFGPLGRLVDALAAVQRLRAVQAHERLTLLTTPNLSVLAKSSSLFDDVSTVEPWQNPAALRTLVQALKKRKFSRIYDLERSKRTHQLQQAFGAFSPPFAGTARRSKWRLPSPPPHPIDADAALLDQVGIEGQTRAPCPGPEGDWLLRRRTGAPSLEPAFFGLERDFILLNLSRRDAGPRWPSAQFAVLARSIVETGISCALVGTIADRAYAREAAQIDVRIKDLCARADYYQLAALGARAKAVLGHADGAARLTCAVGVRTITLHQGQADADANAPRGSGAVAFTCPDLANLPARPVLELLQMFHAFERNRSPK
jgi:ADP-heptose:LPS heptosyltransferase